MSLVGGWVEFKKNQIVKNVSGSQSDKLFGRFNGWLDLWRYVTKTQGEVYCSICENKNKATVGGHVVVGEEVETERLKGKNHVFIIPLCHSCNNKKSGEMSLNRDQNAVYLINYMCDVLPDDSKCYFRSREHLDRLYKSFECECIKAMASACLENCDKERIRGYKEGESKFHSLEEEICYSMFYSRGASLPSENVLPSHRSMGTLETIGIKKSSRTCKIRKCSTCSQKS